MHLGPTWTQICEWMYFNSYMQAQAVVLTSGSFTWKVEAGVTMKTNAYREAKLISAHRRVGITQLSFLLEFLVTVLKKIQIFTTGILCLLITVMVLHFLAMCKR